MIDVEFTDISKTYDPGLGKKKVLAVDGLSLQVHQGEVFGLIGPNGAGKSTTIRLLLGLIRPSRGDIYFRGEPLAKVCIQKEIGYLPENPYLYDHLTLLELLLFSGETSGMGVKSIRERSAELLARLDLDAVGKRPLRTFSKGMLQRAGICFALMHDPAMVVLDEPMSGLDPIGRKMVFDLVLELKARGKTIFFCSHILSDVERLCDRIGIMVGGQLVDTIVAADFGRPTNADVSMELTGCSEELITKLTPLSNAIESGDNRIAMRFSKLNFPQILRVIEGDDVEILSCRSGQVSLEDHFIRVVEGENR